MFEMAERGMATNTKNQIIIKQLQEILYDDAEIPVLAHILEMIRKRKWLSDDAQASYLTAEKGLSIFTVEHIIEDLVTEMNEQIDLLADATQVTAKELSVTKKMKAAVLDNSFKFAEKINTFANLLFALFSSA